MFAFCSPRWRGAYSERAGQVVIKCELACPRQLSADNKLLGRP